MRVSPFPVPFGPPDPPTVFPGTWEQFVRSVVPELQKRGVFRGDYTGRTLREHLHD